VQRLNQLAREHFGRHVIELAVRWLLDQGITVAFWRARHPGQLQPVEEVTGWRLNVATKAEIDRVRRETITDPVGAKFMAPPAWERTAQTEVFATKRGTLHLVPYCRRTVDGNE
jgi:hypothetical protein